MALLQIMGSGSGSVACSGFSVQAKGVPSWGTSFSHGERRARAELIKHIYSFSSDFVHIAFPHVPLVKPSHLIGLISTGKEYAGLEGEIFEPSALFCF